MHPIFKIILLLTLASLCAASPPFTVAPGLFAPSNPATLGLEPAPGAETVTVFHPGDSTDHYSNGVVMIGFKDRLYCQWQSSAQDEDAPNTRVVYSVSTDGRDWSPPVTLAGPLDDGTCTSGGWWVNGDTLVAYINVWPSGLVPRGGYACYRTSTDGVTWSPLQPLRMADGDTLKGIFEQDPHALPDGRIIGAAHFQPGLTVSPIHTDDPSGIRGWVRSDFVPAGDASNAIEPGWFRQKSGKLAMVFRDQNSTFRKLASVSTDRGETWSLPVLTDMPDSRSKQCAGNLPDGSAYLVGNPVHNKTRIPLVLTLSRDGITFDRACLLRGGGDDLQELRYSGKYKRAGYHYPKSIIWNGYLYVSYATNKEDVEFTRVPVDSLMGS